MATPETENEFGPPPEKAKVWKSEGKEQRILRGTLLSVTPFVGKAGNETRRLEVGDAQGERWSIICPTMLLRLISEGFEAGSLGIGKPIAICYDGSTPLDGGMTLKNFRVKPEPSKEFLDKKAREFAQEKAAPESIPF